MYKTFYIFIFVFCFGFGQNEDFVSDVHENYFFEGEYTLMEEIDRYKFEQDSLKQSTLKFGNSYEDGIIFFLDVNESENNLYILNNSKDSLLYSDMLGHRIITEAKDESNNWVPITYIYYPEFVCGNTLSNYLFPNTMHSFGVKKYSGNQKTQIRLKILIENKIYYSNMAEDMINPVSLQLTSFYQKPDSLEMMKDSEVKDAFLFNMPYTMDYIIYKKAFRECNNTLRSNTLQRIQRAEKNAQ